MALHDAVVIYQSAGTQTSLSLCDGHLAETNGTLATSNDLGFIATWQITDTAPYFVAATNVTSVPADEVMEVVRRD